MKKVVFVLIVSAWCFNSFGQNDAFFSHYMFNLPSFNPSLLANNSTANLTLQHRSQWLGYSSSFDGDGGAPSTQAFSLYLPMASTLSGIGLVAINDNLGPVGNFSLELPVSATHILTNGSKLNFGINAGITSQTQKFDELRFNDPSDPLNIGRRETQINPNLGIGISYIGARRFLAGVSVRNLLEPSFDFGLDSLENKLPMTAIGYFGFTRLLTSKLSISPSLITRYDFETVTFDLSAIVNYENIGWAGVSFRRSESIILLVGYNFLEDKSLQVGYGIDYIINEQDAKQPTSHEFYVRYNLPNFVFGGRKQVKTPRYTF